MNNQNYDELLESSQTDSDLKQLVSDIDYFLDFEQPCKFNDENDFNANEYLQHFENIKKAQNIKITKDTDQEIAKEYLDQINKIYP